MPYTPWIDANGCRQGWLTSQTPPGLFAAFAGSQEPDLVWVIDAPQKVAVSVSSRGESFLPWPLEESGDNCPGIYLGPAALALDPGSLVMSDGHYSPGELMFSRGRLSLACTPPRQGFRPQLLDIQAAEQPSNPYSARCLHWALFVKDANGESRIAFERSPPSSQTR